MTTYGRRCAFHYTWVERVLMFYSQFEEYISAALSSVKYRDFVLKGEGGGVLITGGVGEFLQKFII